MKRVICIFCIYDLHFPVDLISEDFPLLSVTLSLLNRARDKEQ